MNALAGLGCIYGGWSEPAAEADHLACAVRDIDHAARVLPGKLRNRALRVSRKQGRDPRDIADQVAIMAGFSPSFGRVVAYRFGGDAMFEPVLTTAEASPELPELHRLREPVPDHVLRIARAQIVELRRGYPEASGGTLTLATIWPDGVHAGRVCELTPA